MMSRFSNCLVVAALGAAASVMATPARAWWDEGYRQIAAVAYKKLTPTATDKVDVLMRLNPDYGKWIANAPDQPL